MDHIRKGIWGQRNRGGEIEDDQDKETDEVRSGCFYNKPEYSLVMWQTNEPVSMIVSVMEKFCLLCPRRP